MGKINKPQNQKGRLSIKQIKIQKPVNCTTLRVNNNEA